MKSGTQEPQKSLQQNTEACQESIMPYLIYMANTFLTHKYN